MLASDGEAGVVLRRLLPVVIVSPVLVAALMLAGRKLGLFSTAVGAWLLASALTVGFATVAWLIAGASARAGQERDRLQRIMLAAAETATDAMMTVDWTGTITYANAALANMFGYELAEIVGRPSEILLSEGECEGVRCTELVERPIELLMLERDRYGHPRRRELFLADPHPRRIGIGADLYARRRDGSEFPVEITLNPIETADGTLVCTSIRDLSDRRRAEEATARLAAIVESGPNAIIALKPDGTIESWNDAAERLFGYTVREATGRPITIIEAAGGAAILERVSAALAGGTVRFETVSANRDEIRVEVEITLSAIRSSADAVIGVCCLVLDISERISAQRELERLADAVGHGTDAVISIDLGQRVRHWNRGAERLYGFAAEEAIGRDLRELTALTDEPSDQIVRMRAGERSYQYETQRRRKDGSIIDVLLTVSPWHVDGCVVGVTGISIDLSERKRAERARAHSLEDLEEAQRVANVGSWSWDPREDVATWSAQMYEIFGRDPADGPATSDALFEYLHSEDRDRVAAGYAETFGGRDAFELDYRIVDGNGMQRCLHGLGHMDPARPGCYVGTVQDVSEQRRAEAELRDSEERLRTSFDGAPIGVALTEPEIPFTMLQTNRALGKILGVKPEELVGRAALTLFERPAGESAQRELQGLLDGDRRSVELEFQVSSGGPDPPWVNLTGAAITGADGLPERLVLHVQDITDRKRYEQELRTWAERDALTGLLNRRKLEEELDRAVAENTRYGTPATLLVCDLDNLKLVNDTLGHKAGDELIRGVARAFGDQVRDTDLLARTGGDEFAVLMPHTGLEEARAMGERLRSSLVDLDLVAGPHKLHTTLSAGLAPVGGGLTVEQTLAGADLAMYEAKRHGRNRVSTSHQAFSDGVMTQQLSWLGRLRGALADGRFELHAQPIIELRSREARCRELLLRMREEDGELLMPAAFIPTAERFGLIAELDRWVVGEAIRILAADQRSAIIYTVNLSGVSVGDSELLAMIESEIADAGVDPRRLVFEFTETAAISDLSASREFTEGLSRIGCASALDDFGSGFGSFAYLKRLPVQYLKIDGEFVRNLPGTNDDRVLVKAIVDLARGLRKQTIAEFVGSEEALVLLGEYGVDYAQGFYLGMPEPLSSVG
jgi:diguanylate cyclase (GGDEF)-like protein/PAS domain S-box-containing protein